MNALMQMMMPLEPEVTKITLIVKKMVFLHTYIIYHS